MAMSTQKPTVPKPLPAEKGEESWIFASYRPLWFILNIILFVVACLDIQNSRDDIIKIDLPNIEVQTKKIVKNDEAAQTLATNFGFKTRSAAGLSFCDWANSAAVKPNLKAPFDDLDCTKHTSVSLKDFQAYDLHTFAGAAESTVWDIYAYGEPDQDGQLFANGATIKKPTKDIMNKYLDDNGVYLEPRECSTKHRNEFYTLTLIFVVTLVLYILAHMMHWLVNVMFVKQVKFMDWIVFIFSFIVYIFAIVVFAIHRNNTIFSECAWMSTWFQKDNMTLYGNLNFYISLGVFGLVFCILHIIALNKKWNNPNWVYSLVVTDQMLP